MKTTVAIIGQFPPHALSDEFPAPKGHYATWFPQIAEAFGEQNEFSLHWIVLTKAVHQYTLMERWGQQFHLVPRKFLSIDILTGHLYSVHKLKSLLKSIGADFLHCWGVEDGSGIIGRKLKIPYMLSMQGILTHYKQVAKLPFFLRMQARREIDTISRAKLVTAESSWGREKVEEISGHKDVRNVEYGVDSIFYSRHWDPCESSATALFVGSVTERKGIIPLIQAFRGDDLSEMELVVIGEGDIEEELRIKSTSNIKWLGRQTRKSTADAMSRAWCLVLPTKADTSPNVVKEARVMGLPIVTTSDGGQVDYVDHGKNGFIVEATPEQLREALLQIFQSLEGVRLLGHHRHEEARSWFRPERTANAFRNTYREMAELALT